jgi:heme/copper-type cytochrome/quinol oxidase subunit 1
MNRQRRILTSIALGVGLAIVASAVVAELFGSDYGWFMYAPDDSSMYVTSDGSPFGAAAVRLAAVGIWLAVSWRLFRSEE